MLLLFPVQWTGLQSSFQCCCPTACLVQSSLVCRRRCLACHKSSTCDHSADEPGRSVDEFGDHTTGCKHMLSLRTKLWHDPLVQMWRQLAKMSGLSCGSEVKSLMVNSNKRADVVLYKGLYNVLTDVRTIAGGDQRYCCAAALSPGYGAAWGAVQKDAAWLAQVRSQGGSLRNPFTGRLLSVLPTIYHAQFVDTYTIRCMFYN